jgi:hypothetical protein
MTYHLHLQHHFPHIPPRPPTTETPQETNRDTKTFVILQKLSLNNCDDVKLSIFIFVPKTCNFCFLFIKRLCDPDAEIYTNIF